MCRTGSRTQQLQVVTEVLGKAGNPEKYAVIGKLQSKSGNRFAKLEVVTKLRETARNAAALQKTRDIFRHFALDCDANRLSSSGLCRQ